MWPSQDQPRGLTAIVFLGDHGDDASLLPRAVRHLLDLGLAGMEMPLLPVLGQDGEAAEVAEAIIIDRDHLAGDLMFAVRRVRRPLSWYGPDLRWRDLARVAAQSGDQTFSQAEIPPQHRTPAARRRRHPDPPLEPGQEPLLRIEQFARRLDCDRVLECALRLSPGEGL